ncbi:autotransporter outer membrane beta-barrel domain-containing protein [Pseudomonas aeruginosa]|uniref:autotransporter outer membrane beta-barrel domain-containing protein n=1 Tax=Pseudomonas aeruginosa TaxID=287 RepID=UPI000B14713D|nr:autotransporter outer membrane beta-barrel domain-containing protein [Pseudomonas aeruginosa]
MRSAPDAQSWRPTQQQPWSWSAGNWTWSFTRGTAVWVLFWACSAGAQDYDQVIRSDQSSTVLLSKPGNSVLVDSGVTIAPASGSGIYGRLGDRWHVTNWGTVQASLGESAVRLQDITSEVSNHGLIHGSSSGIDSRSGLALFNAPRAAIRGSFGVIACDALRLRNSGQIEGKTTGISYTPDYHGQPWEVVNDGLIRGGYFGVRSSASTDSVAEGTVHNLAGGRIEAIGPAGVGVSVLHAFNTVRNDAGGVIEGTRHGISGGDLFTKLHVVNAGSITGRSGAGIWSYGGGPISNLAGGSIAGAGGVAYVRSRFNPNNVLVNAGTITGNGERFVAGNGTDAGSGTGLYIGAVHGGTGTLVNNERGGAIGGSFFGIYSGPAAMASDSGSVTVINAGSITGRTGISLNGAAGVVVNRGSISGSDGNAIAFDPLEPFQNRLTLDTGSVLNGNVLGGPGRNELILLGTNSEDAGKLHDFQIASMQGIDWTLTGDGAFGTATHVNTGTLRVDGRLNTPLTHVHADATLAGSGTLMGDVVVEGALAPGGASHPTSTLTIDGRLTLSASSVLDYQLGAADHPGGQLNDLTVVTGDLTLGGTLNVRAPAAGTFGPGLYRLFNYEGMLTDNGMALGQMPAGSDSALLTTIPGQVSLVNRAGVQLSFWDGDSGPAYNGQVDGGDGTWQASGGNLNWTSAIGTVNDGYAAGSFATFTGKPGTVTVDDRYGHILSSGMQFATGGYRLQGDSIGLTLGNNVFRVGDGTAQGQALVATIDAPLRGTGGLEKTDLGTLVLSGANSYTGSTLVSGGRLQAGAAGIFASSAETIVQRAGTLDLNGHDQVANRLSGDGSILLAGATLTTNNATEGLSSRFGGSIVGSGALSKIGSGSLSLAGAGSEVGAVHVREGTLRFEQRGAFTTAGDFTTHAGARTEVGARASTLQVGGVFSQASNAHLDVTLGAAPDITARSARLGGTLSISGFDASGQPVRASQMQDRLYTMLQTAEGITGSFSNNPLSGIGPDYLPATGGLSDDGKRFDLGFRLAWSQGGQALGTGTFSLAANTAFDVDMALVDQPGSFNSGWDGRSLTKDGEGLLVLSNPDNSYSGVTTVARGVLRTSATDVFAKSSAVTVSKTGTLDLAGHDQVANRLSGAGTIQLGGATLTVNNAAAADSSTFEGAISGTGGLVKVGSGSLTLLGPMDYRGVTHIQGGQLVFDGSLAGARLHTHVSGQFGSTLSLRNGAMLTGAMERVDVDLDAASTWSIAGHSHIGRLSNAGSIGFVTPSVPMTEGRTLTVRSLDGIGGTIGLHTVLGGSGSVTDRIVIDGGRAQGHSVLEVLNAGGLGDHTTGDGIPLVTAVNGATTDAHAFTLGSPVLAGPYRYHLQRGGDGAAEDWFLVSGREDAGASRREYRAETSLYSALPSRAVRYGETVLGSYHERRGAGADMMPSGGPRAWTRAIAQSDRGTGSERTVRGDAHLSAFQFGADVYDGQFQAGSVRAGLYGALGQSHGWADHTDAAGSRARAGRVDFTGYSFGLYGTWLNGRGGYLDGVLQATRYDAKSRSGQGMKLSTHGHGLIASLEAGRRVELMPNWHLQPQAQLVLQHLDLRDSEDSAGQVKFADLDTGLLRLGTRLSHEFGMSDHAPASVWLSADVMRRFNDQTRTRFATPTQGDVNFDKELPGTSLRIQLGIEGQVSKRIAVDARLGMDQSLDGIGFDSLSGQIGLKVSF